MLLLNGLSNQQMCCVLHKCITKFSDKLFLIFLCFARLTDEIEMGVFVTRFVSCVILFVLGLRAPGIMTTRDYLNLNNSSSEHNIEIDVSPYMQSCNAQLLYCLYCILLQSLTFQLQVLMSLMVTRIMPQNLSNFEAS